VIAVFASTYSVPLSQQRHRTLGSFWFFVLSNPYVLTTIAIALVLGLCALRRAGRRQFEEDTQRDDAAAPFCYTDTARDDRRVVTGASAR
jgi:hypothetical protein